MINMSGMPCGAEVQVEYIHTLTKSDTLLSFHNMCPIECSVDTLQHWKSEIISFLCTTGLMEEIQKRLSKVLEPAPMKAPKALPKPDDIVRKRRGGRRLVLVCSCFFGGKARST